MDKKRNIPIVPGRGLNTSSALCMRQDFLKKQGLAIDKISQHQFSLDQITHNIESFIGATEIPLGIAGPLLNKKTEELHYCAAGTLEGALLASMNRGSKAISQSGGFTAEVIHQKMTRSPLFQFEQLTDAIAFSHWVEKRFTKIKNTAEKFSNHAQLNKTQASIVGKNVHLKFEYSTGDASGQNMTTTCTWHAMLWIVEHFQAETHRTIEHFVIEGNGASDKKVSHSSMISGRGIHVISECFLDEQVITKTLRTSSDQIIRCFSPSLAMSKIDGMVGYNINVANAIAAIYVATGQDLGSLHESSTGILTLEKTEKGLYLALNLPNLVIGTVGGGTHLPKQQEALKLMGCNGSNKVKRFAEIIAGFALALEISTYSAIVSGEFAKAHEKLGRNKPKNWLNKSDINIEFVKAALTNKAENIERVEISSNAMIDNGILTDIAKKVNKKLIGFVPLTLFDNKEQDTQVLIKSKALDVEVIKGLHIMAASIDPTLSDFISEYRKKLEYHNCHKKEIAIFEYLSDNNYNCTPTFLGKHIDENKETWLFIQEFLYYSDLKIYNSENNPELWGKQQIKQVIRSISQVHLNYNSDKGIDSLAKTFKPWQAKPLYHKLVDIMYQEVEDENEKAEYALMKQFINELEGDNSQLKVKNTLIHNDFNSRNIAIRNNGNPCIYDWELAVINIPHRDIVEFLSFVLKEDFTKEELMHYLDYHHLLNQKLNHSWKEWKKAYVYALKEYLTTRVSFYQVCGILIKFPFSDRIQKTSFKMLNILMAE